MEDPVDGRGRSAEPKQVTKVSQRKLRANRQNALKSTGPKTRRGKAYGRRNALKHGLFAKDLFRDCLIQREIRRVAAE